MTLQEYIDHVRMVLDEYDTDISFWTDDELTKWLNEALMEVSKITKFLTARAYIEPTNDDEYTLPDDFIDWYKVKLNDEFIDEISIEQGQDDEETGFYIWGDTIFLSNYETDDKITLYYYKTAQKMVSLSDENKLPLQYEDIIIPFCLYRAFMKDQKADMAQLNQKEFYERVNIMKKRYNREPSRAEWKVIR